MGRLEIREDYRVSGRRVFMRGASQCSNIFYGSACKLVARCGGEDFSSGGVPETREGALHLLRPHVLAWRFILLELHVPFFYSAFGYFSPSAGR